MKILPNGIAVVESDSHLSRWVEDQGTLEVAKGFCELFREYIPNGGTVFDVGACLGDHTATYSAMVGNSGLVVAFEPNPEALACLQHNMALKTNVKVVGVGLGDYDTTAKCVKSDAQSLNLGATMLEEGGEVKIARLDDYTHYLNRLDFIKIDAEGWEPRIIKGAVNSIIRLKPVMLIELNDGALAKYGKTRWNIIHPLIDLGYDFKPAEPHYDMKAPQVDVIFYPK